MRTARTIGCTGLTSKHLLQVVKLVQQFPQLGLRRQTAEKSLLYLYERSSKQNANLLMHSECFLDTPRFTLLFDRDRY